MLDFVVFITFYYTPCSIRIPEQLVTPYGTTPVPILTEILVFVWMIPQSTPFSSLILIASPQPPPPSLTSSKKDFSFFFFFFFFSFFFFFFFFSFFFFFLFSL